jgi:hypothetical protein
VKLSKSVSHFLFSGYRIIGRAPVFIESVAPVWAAMTSFLGDELTMREREPLEWKKTNSFYSSEQAEQVPATDTPKMAMNSQTDSAKDNLASNVATAQTNASAAINGAKAATVRFGAKANTILLRVRHYETQ